MKPILLAVQILQVLRCVSLQDENYLEFPKGFSIGAATSAYQVEGAWNVSDKSEGVWDHRVHTNASLIKNGDNGDIACDSYHQYRGDVQLAKTIGLNHYRFSISWSRVLPTGSPDQISKDGIQYYKNLIDALLNNGIEPFVTLHHFDDVQSVFDKTGGWGNETMVEYFAEYARVMFRELGPKVKFWTTINEVNIYCRDTAYLNETTPDTAYVSRYLCAHNLLKAHARAYHIYDEEFRSIQKGKIGVVVSSGYYIPKSSNDTKSADIAFAFETGWIMDPVFSKHGGYPEVVKQRIAENSKAEGLSRSRLPEFSPEWIDYIKGTFDYFGLNHYITAMVEPENKTNGRWYDDVGIAESFDADWRRTAMGWPVQKLIFEYAFQRDSRWLDWQGDGRVAVSVNYDEHQCNVHVLCPQTHREVPSMISVILGTNIVVPEGMGALLRKIKDTYDNPPVYIMENGASELSGVIDIDRIEYLYSYMKEVLLAIRDGCDVRAYSVWSLLDNLEWLEGYSQPFGLVHVDFEDPKRKRTPKLSSYWLEIIMHERKLLPLNETMLHMMKLQ